MELLDEALEAASHREDIPTWPVLIQKEISPEYTGWSATGEARTTQCSGEKKVALYDVESDGGDDPKRKGIALLTLEGASALGEDVRIGWGLERGRWYVISVATAEDEETAAAER